MLDRRLRIRSMLDGDDRRTKGHPQLANRDSCELAVLFGSVSWR